MFKHNGRILAGLICAASLVGEASAQTDNRLALGVSVTSRVAGSDTAGSSAKVGFEWRLGHQKQAWGWQSSVFNWFNTDIAQQTTVMRPVDLGQLRIRPVMVGYGYTWIRGRAAITTDLVGGFSFNSFHVDGPAAAAYLKLGGTDVTADASNAFAVKPEVQLWYDLNRRIGIKLNGGYLMTRPSITIKSSLGSDKWSVNADTFLITVAVVYSII